MNVVLLLGGFLWLFAVLPADAAEPQLCSSVADVSWQTNATTLTVDGAIVDVASCEDGAPVGIQLITDDGDVPSEGPLMGAVEGGKEVFDLKPYEQRIEPVTGVRVFLELNGEELVFYQVTVDRRYFNAADNEQRGLRQITSLQVPLDGQYVVPGAPGGYQDVDCTDVNTTVDDDVIAQGSGTFPVTTSGRHLACYQQVPGTPPDIPDEQEPEVLDESLTSDDSDVEVLGTSERAPTSTGAGQLARTGAGLGLLLLLGASLTLGGWRLIRSRR